MNMQVSTDSPPLLQAIPLELLRESPTNPRRTFGDLGDLVESIKGKGILQPLLARPVDGGAYELVFGHRRLRAAKLAGLASAPVMVRELDDKAVLEAQVVENAQREDIHPLEEAEAYEQLHTTHGYSVDEIAAKVGKSRASVYARMKLCALSPAARKAFYDGRVSAAVALYVARIPHHQLQDQALEELLPYDEDDDPVSAREAFRIIQGRYMLRLADAPFDAADAALVPDAGACGDCPKRTGNQRELFADVDSADVCTDTDCYGRKRAAHIAQEAAKLEEKGVRVVEGVKDTHGGTYVAAPTGFVRLQDWCQEAGTSYADVLKGKRGAQVERAVMFDARGERVELVEKKAVAALVKPAAADADMGKKDTGKDALERRVEAKRTALAIEAIVAAVVRREPNLAFWRALTAAVLDETHGSGDEAFARRGLVTEEEELAGASTEELMAKVKDFDERQLRGLVVEMIITSTAHLQDAKVETPFKRFCGLLKIDPKSYAKAARDAVRAEDGKKAADKAAPAKKSAKKASKR